MGDFKLDRAAFKAHTSKEAASHAEVYKNLDHVNGEYYQL